MIEVIEKINQKHLEDIMNKIKSWFQENWFKLIRLLSFIILEILIIVPFFETESLLKNGDNKKPYFYYDITDQKDSYYNYLTFNFSYIVFDINSFESFNISYQDETNFENNDFYETNENKLDSSITFAISNSYENNLLDVNIFLKYYGTKDVVMLFENTIVLNPNISI